MTANKLVAVISSLAVIGAVLLGLYIAGSPSAERLRRLDEQRIGDLSRISRAIGAYFKKSESLPSDLSAIIDGQRMRSLPTDPETQADYAYEIIDPHSYSLCAEFSKISDEVAAQDFWSHAPGLHCFELEL